MPTATPTPLPTATPVPLPTATPVPEPTEIPVATTEVSVDDSDSEPGTCGRSSNNELGMLLGGALLAGAVFRRKFR